MVTHTPHILKGLNVFLDPYAVATQILSIAKRSMAKLSLHPRSDRLQKRLQGHSGRCIISQRDDFRRHFDRCSFQQLFHDA